MGAGDATVGTTAFAAQAPDALRLRLPAVGTRVGAGEVRGGFGPPATVRAPRPPASGGVLEVDSVPAGDPGAVGAAADTAGRLFGLRVDDVAGAPPAEAYAAHCADIRGGRR